MILEQHYKPEEVAAKLGISRSKVYRMCGRRVLRSVLIEGNRRIPESAVTDYLEALNGEPKGDTNANVRALRRVG